MARRLRGSHERKAPVAATGASSRQLPGRRALGLPAPGSRRLRGDGDRVGWFLTVRNGSLGAGWTDDSDGGLSIVSGQVVGNGGNSGDLRTGESYPSDQLSQLAVGSAQLSGTQWIGPAVRMQASGQSGYVGFYYWNNGNPELMLFLRKAGNWKELGAYSSGALSAGTQLQVTAVGSTISVAAERGGAGHGE